MWMRIQQNILEYELHEAAAILGLSASELEKAVQAGRLKYFYRNRSGYKFHDASIEENRRRLNSNLKNNPRQKS